MNMHDENLIRRTIGPVRLVVVALAAGLVGFAGVVAAMRASGIEGDGELQFVTWIGLGLLAAHLAAAPLILGALDRNVNGAWPDAYVRRTVVGCALTEGPALLCLLGSLLDGQPLGLVAGLCGAAVMLVLYFPTVERVRSFAERRQEASQAGDGSGIRGSGFRSGPTG